MFVTPFSEFFKRIQNPKVFFSILVFIILYKLGDAFGSAINSPFLISKGYQLKEIGFITKTTAMVAVIIGGIIGGMLMTNLGMFKSLMLFGLLQVVSNYGYYILSINEPNLYLLGVVFAIENFCGGLGTAAFVAFLMSLCNINLSASQYALFSSLASVGRSFISAPFAGEIQSSYGWDLYYIFSVVIGIPGLLLLFFLRDYINKHDKILQK